VERWIVYVDMDAYYVACELRDRPDLVGQRVIVGPDPHQGPTRGVVLSASYEARREGVRSAMPVAQADRLSPTATWISPDFPKYEKTAEEIRRFLRSRCSEVLPLSIDEAALRVEFPDADAAGAWARNLQQELRQELRLSASLGVAHSRVVAKIASERAKPGGVVVVPPATTAEFLAPLSVRAIPGVGPKTEKALADEGLRTIGELREARPDRLRHAVGGFARELKALAEGRPVEPEEFSMAPPRSRSTDHTFASDVHDPEELVRTAEMLAGGLGRALEQEGLRYQRASIGIRWSDFSRNQSGKSFPVPQSGAEALTAAVARLVRTAWSDEVGNRGRGVRTLSVRVERLSPGEQVARPLESFEDANASSRSVK
jgi:nucleotidyltransferase/DNA polymerase involved in DNA repair